MAGFSGHANVFAWLRTYAERITSSYFLDQFTMRHRLEITPFGILSNSGVIALFQRNKSCSLIPVAYVQYMPCWNLPGGPQGHLRRNESWRTLHGYT
jgi:hypothetical protein